MNKKPKKIIQKEKEKEKSNKLVKDKLKNKQEKNNQLPQSKIQLNSLKISKANTETKKCIRNIKVHNSICSKEDVKKKLFPAKIRNKPTKENLISTNTYHKSNKLISSNYLFLTNDTNNQPKEKENNKDKEKEKDKKIKKNKNIKNYSNGEKINLPELNLAFKKNKLKKTIIIDDEGNNNLNLNLQKGINDYKQILKIKKEENNSILSNSFNGNTETNSLFDNSSKICLDNIYFNNMDVKNKQEDIKQTIIDKNEEERRLKEYNKLFNLLNSNIEQFKKMFNSNKNINTNQNTNNNINKNNNINYNKNKKIIIKNKKDINDKICGSRSHSKQKENNKFQNKKIQTNLKKHLSEKNLSSMNKYSRNNNNIFPFDIKNDNIEKEYNENINEINNNNCSFLESSIQDDFYKSLINQTFLQNISYISFEINTDEISNDNKKNENNNNKISLTENNTYKNNNLMRLERDKKEENMKSKFRSPNLKLKGKIQENSEEKNRKVINDNICKTYSNDIDKNNCIII